MEQFIFIASNISGFVAGICVLISMFAKDKFNILVCNCFSSVFFMLSVLGLNSYSGILINGFMLCINAFLLFGEMKRGVKALIVVIGGALSVYFNNNGMVGLLPAAASMMYIYAVCFQSNHKTIIRIIGASNILWCIYHIGIGNYASAVCNVAIFVTAIYRTGALLNTSKPKKEVKI